MLILQLFDTKGASVGQVTIEEDDWSPLVGDSVPGTEHEIVDVIDRAVEEPGYRLIVQPITY
ncbi:MAG TPA: hypothetical protein VH063_12150 [Gaiellaceae bacterium]|nr:hypothetical protein [Gaiellaceae bacterium]